MKVAIGAARGLRYLHEDCRVGCIVHRDFKPNNILLTHDFEPMVSLFSHQNLSSFIEGKNVLSFFFFRFTLGPSQSLMEIVLIR